MFRRIIIAATILAGAACSESGTDKSGLSYALLQKEALGVYDNDNSLFVYDSDIYQYAYNTRRHSFRIQNTSQSRTMTCVLESAPQTDRYVGVKIETRGISSLPSRQIEALVLKQSQGKVWLWDEKTGTGLIIRLE